MGDEGNVGVWPTGKVRGGHQASTAIVRSASGVIRWLLSVEKQLRSPDLPRRHSNCQQLGESSEVNAEAQSLQKHMILLVGLILSYHVILFVIFWGISAPEGDGSYPPALFFSLFLDLIAILTLLSMTTICSPMTVALGLDDEHATTDGTMLSCLNAFAAGAGMEHDPTSRWMAVGHVAAFVVNVMGESIVFATVGASSNQPDDDRNSHQREKLYGIQR